MAFMIMFMFMFMFLAYVAWKGREREEVYRLIAEKNKSHV